MLFWSLALLVQAVPCFRMSSVFAWWAVWLLCTQLFMFCLRACQKVLFFNFAFVQLFTPIMAMNLDRNRIIALFRSDDARIGLEAPNADDPDREVILCCHVLLCFAICFRLFVHAIILGI